MVIVHLRECEYDLPPLKLTVENRWGLPGLNPAPLRCQACALPYTQLAVTATLLGAGPAEGHVGHPREPP